MGGVWLSAPCVAQGCVYKSPWKWSIFVCRTNFTSETTKESELEYSVTWLRIFFHICFMCNLIIKNVPLWMEVKNCTFLPTLLDEPSPTRKECVQRKEWKYTLPFGVLSFICFGINFKIYLPWMQNLTCRYDKLWLFSLLCSSFSYWSTYL